MLTLINKKLFIINIIDNKNYIEENKNIKINFNKKNVEYIITLLNSKLKHIINFYYKVIIKYALIIIKFIKLLIIYLIEKYYYNLSDAYFVIKASRNLEVLKFFMIITKIKEYFDLKPKEDKPYVRLIYYYLLLIPIYVYIAPLIWFLLRVATDPQNYINNMLDKIIILPMPLLN